MYKRTFCILILICMLMLGAAQAEEWQNGRAQTVIGEVNMERARRGLGSLRVDSELMIAA